MDSLVLSLCLLRYNRAGQLSDRIVLVLNLLMACICLLFYRSVRTCKQISAARRVRNGGHHHHGPDGQQHTEEGEGRHTSALISTRTHTASVIAGTGASRSDLDAGVVSTIFNRCKCTYKAYATTKASQTY